MPRALALALVVVAAALPLFLRARDAIELAVAATFALGCAALVRARREQPDWLVTSFPIASGCLLALGLAPLAHAQSGAAADVGLVAQEPGHMPLLVLRCLTVAVVYWASLAHAEPRVRARLLVIHAAAVALSTLHLALLALPLAVALAALAVATMPAPSLPGLPVSPRALTRVLVAVSWAAFAAGSFASPTPPTAGPPTTDEPAANTRYWMDVRDNPFRAAPHARRWAAREAATPGEGTLRLARLGLRTGETDAARALLRRVASDASERALREEARRLLTETDHD